MRATTDTSKSNHPSIQPFEHSAARWNWKLIRRQQHSLSDTRYINIQTNVSALNNTLCSLLLNAGLPATQCVPILISFAVTIFCALGIRAENRSHASRRNMPDEGCAARSIPPWRWCVLTASRQCNIISRLAIMEKRGRRAHHTLYNESALMSGARRQIASRHTQRLSPIVRRRHGEWARLFWPRAMGWFVVNISAPCGSYAAVHQNTAPTSFIKF